MNTPHINFRLSTLLIPYTPCSTAKLADEIIYKGTDLLILAPYSHLVQRAYVSADYFKETFLKGLKICFQRDPVQNPVCADPPPPT
jgi:hypothetical protein